MLLAKTREVISSVQKPRGSNRCYPSSGSVTALLKHEKTGVLGHQKMQARRSRTTPMGEGTEQEGENRRIRATTHKNERLPCCDDFARRKHIS